MNPPQLHIFPFSRRGSWMNFYRKNPGTDYGGNPDAPLSLRVVAGTLWEEAEIFDLDLERDGAPVVWQEDVSPGQLTLREKSGAGEIRIAFQDEHTVRLRLEGVTLCLTLRKGKPLRSGHGGWAVRAGSCSWLLLAGNIEVKEPDEKNARWEIRVAPETELLIHRTSSAGVPPALVVSLEDCAKKSREGFEEWAQRFPVAKPEFAAVRERELWNVWNLIVHPLGNFRREVVLVSKGFLVGLWSWDHCWHALGTAGIDPELSWNCFMALFDHQDKHGALPDVMSANQLYWTVLKPPVHGWMLGLLEERHSWFGDEHRCEIYPALASMTRFWLRERDEEGIPYYLDGCDSGWDNATVFDRGFPIQTPDLTTWLILQQEWLAKTARRLGLEDEARDWEHGAQTLLAKMLDHFWTGNAFVARRGGTHEAVPSDSLLLRIPLLLGDRLPKEARRWCLDGLLEGSRYRAPFGLLTEPRESPFFDGDGYWRGPMWPVATFVFVEGLRANGHEKESSALARDFVRHVETAGNFENYRGDDGRGVRDTSIAWTSTCVLSFLTHSI